MHRNQVFWTPWNQNVSNKLFNFHKFRKPFKRQPHKIVKHSKIADVILAIQLKKNREHYSGDCIPVARS